MADNALTRLAPQSAQARRANALQQFLQAASNEVAGGVSAPVDMIAWALRKAGIPVGDAPIGGSDWMAQQGLTKDVPQSAASLAGSTAALVSPIAAAAKGPQIARGLLKGADNLAQPRMLDPQTGAIVWHGSPHKFDKFDSSKIGTGEGAQAYGHGLYVAESPEVAKSYMRPAGRTPSEIDGKNVIDAAYADRSLERAARYLQDYGTPDEAIKWSGLNGDEKTSELLRNLVAAGRLKKAPDGEFYKVDLPDEAIAKMLDWDKPLSEQAPEVQKALEAASESPMLRHLSKSTFGDDVDARGLLDRLSRAWRRDYGKGGEPEVVDVLRQSGIPGIRYLDGGSRSAGQGSRNYVVFPGEEGLLKILERNGQGL